MNSLRDRVNESIMDRINSWHTSDSDQDLHEWLGWSPIEYTVWFESSEPPEREIQLHECVSLQLEVKKMREADVSDGSKVKWGHSKHIRDLKKRIDDLTVWRDKHKKGSEVRANYSRIIQKLKSELKSAQEASEKKKRASKR